MQYLCVNQISWLNVQYPFSRLSFINIKGLNMIKMVVNSFTMIPSYFVYHTLVDVNIV
jgi:hypothetical protein